MARDLHAARRIAELRQDLGLSPEALSYVIHLQSPSTPVSGRTIRRIEKDGVIPTPRVKFGIALALGMKPSQIWCVSPAGVPVVPAAAMAVGVL